VGDNYPNVSRFHGLRRWVSSQAKQSLKTAAGGLIDGGGRVCNPARRRMRCDTAAGYQKRGGVLGYRRLRAPCSASVY